MNNPSDKNSEHFNSLDAETQLLRDDLEEVYRLPVPAMRFDPLTAAPAFAGTVKWRWRPALALSAAAAGLFVFLAGPSLFGGSPAEVNAQEVLERTQAVAATNSPIASSQSYRMVARTESFGPPGLDLATMNTTSATWYLDAEHQRSETYDENGQLVFGQSQNGNDLWFYSTVMGAAAPVSGDPDPGAIEPGELRAVHSTLDKTGARPFNSQDFGVSSLASLLELYSGKCATAESIGEETVAGRPTYVIEVTQTPDTCDIEPVVSQDGDRVTVKVEDPDGGALAPGASIAVAGSAHMDGEGDSGDPDFSFSILQTTTRIWVDQETFITLKSETKTDEGMLLHYEVTDFEIAPEFDASTFVYEPPAGVDVIEAESFEGMKIVLSGGVGFGSGGTVEAGNSEGPNEEGTTAP